MKVNVTALYLQQESSDPGAIIKADIDRLFAALEPVREVDQIVFT